MSFVPKGFIDDIMDQVDDAMKPYQDKLDEVIELLTEIRDVLRDNHGDSV